MVHAAGDEEPLRRVSALRGEPRTRSVLAALQPAPVARALPGGAAAAYLGAARYVAGARIDTSLFQGLTLRPHRGRAAGRGPLDLT